MVGHTVAEHLLPGIREAPECRRHMRADRLALGPRRALAGATVELGEHRLVLHGGWLNIADARAHGSSSSDLARTMPQRGYRRNLRMADACETHCAGFRACAMHIRGACGP